MAVQSTVQQATQRSLAARVLQANAVFSAVSGLAMVLGSQALAAFMGITAPLVLVAVGVLLMIYAADLWYISTRETLDHRWLMLAIGLDLAWVIGSAVLLFSGWLPLTTAGKWTIAIVADIVLVFAGVQYYALRKLA